MSKAIKFTLVFSFAICANFLAPIFGLVNKVSASPFYLHVSKGLKKSKFIGEWRVETQVVWSDCPYVKPGQKANSKMVINDFNGRIYPTWNANGWKLLENSQINIEANNSIKWERVNALVDNDDVWKTESVDKFDLTKSGAMLGESLVKQFLNGDYVGSYMTVSFLVKV